MTKEVVAQKPVTKCPVRTAAAPAMPVIKDHGQEHREKIPLCSLPFNVAVARKVSRTEVEKVPEARLAVDKEWNKLAETPYPDGLGKGVWDIKGVREASEVRAEANRTNTVVHFGRIAELCFQKNSELEDGDPLKMYKGRHVCLGNNVKDQYFQFATFENLSSGPPILEAWMAVDAVSLQDGYEGTASDANSAYTQEFLGGGRGKGIPTVVRIPKHRWPKEWRGKYNDPVVPLILALYGHPDAGGYWEARCENIVLDCGFTKVEGWDSVYWNEQKQSLLIVYVDDFKLASLKKYTKEIWKELRARIKLSEPGPFDRSLCCYLEKFEVPCENVRSILQNNPALHPRGPCEMRDGHKLVHGYRYNMEQYLDKVVNKYCALADVQRSSLKKVNTPFLNEGLEAKGCESKPEDADNENDEDPEEGGTLDETAASIIMSVMFAASFARAVLLRATCHLSTSLHYWDEYCDKKLLRLVSYINCTLKHRQVAFIGDPLEECELATFADANYAERVDSKSTGGGLIAVFGPHTFYPLGKSSKKQGSAANSAVEAELVSMNTVVRCQGIPLLDLMDIITGEKMKMVVYEDNQATACIVKSGKFLTMAHVKRVHGVQLSLLHELYKREVFLLKDCHTRVMAADIFTKFFIDTVKWMQAILLIGIVEGKEVCKCTTKVPVAAATKSRMTYLTGGIEDQNSKIKSLQSQLQDLQRQIQEVLGEVGNGNRNGSESVNMF